MDSRSKTENMKPGILFALFTGNLDYCGSAMGILTPYFFTTRMRAPNRQICPISGGFDKQLMKLNYMTLALRGPSSPSPITEKPLPLLMLDWIELLLASAGDHCFRPPKYPIYLWKYGNLEGKICDLENKLGRINENKMTTKNKLRSSIVTKELEGLLKDRQIKWKQHSKTEWLKKEDKKHNVFSR
ncbi:hypothetical protein Salat_2915200 [Sesamum alatum]|uniref:Uncharacterized protein n=1 Tax=Sesamum alatum TaxID=300844 RepID=A0AAE1XJP4_9LAMI|nr:hypothetical protein Salat_2915200 [Sesamum alatum]